MAVTLRHSKDTIANELWQQGHGVLRETIQGLFRREPISITFVVYLKARGSNDRYPIGELGDRIIVIDGHAAGNIHGMASGFDRRYIGR